MSRRQQRSLPAPLGRLSVVVFDALSHSSQASCRHADPRSDRRVAAGGCAASLRGYSHRDAAANAPQPRLRPRQRATGAAAASVRTLEQCARRRFFGGKWGAGGRISGRRQPSGGLQVADSIRKRHPRPRSPRLPQRPRPPPTCAPILTCPCGVQSRAIEGQKLRLGGDALGAEPTYLLYLRSGCRRRLGSVDFGPASAQPPVIRPAASSPPTALRLEITSKSTCFGS